MLWQVSLPYPSKEERLIVTGDEPRSFRVRVVRSGNWWAITVPELPGVFSQARRLDQVEEMACEAIAMMLDVSTEQIGRIEPDIEPPAVAADVIETMHSALATARAANGEATAARREAAQLLRQAGLPMRDVGHLLGISHQRVSQILTD